jgi:hypothetical protein
MRDMEEQGRKSVTDREVRRLFSPIHVGGHHRMLGRELQSVWDKMVVDPGAKDIIDRYGLTPDDISHLYQRFHDLITQ